MVGLLSGSITMDFPLCLPILEPVSTGSFNFLNIELSSRQRVRGIASTPHNLKLFRTLNTII
jgi:hypothetical protein